MKVSAIIPVCGEEPYLEAAVRNLDGEVIVVVCPAQVWAYAHTPSRSPGVDGARIRFVRQDNDGGRAGALNQGAGVAGSDVLLFQDADVVAPPGLVREGLDLLAGCEIVSAVRRHRNLGWSVPFEPFLRLYGTRARFVTGWWCMMRRSTFERVGGWRRDYLDDIEFWIRARRTCRVRFVRGRVELMRRVRAEWPKIVHTLKHMVGNRHRHP